MPEGTKVHKLYEALLAKGYNKSSAAKIAQKKTGEALATGKPPKNCEPKKYQATQEVKMDVPFLIRIFEVVREDIKSDEDLHKLVEQLLKLDGTITSDYDKIKKKEVVKYQNPSSF